MNHELPPQKTHTTDQKYSILHGHNRTDGSYKSLETLEMEYVELTDKLIAHMTNGIDTTVNGERDHVIPTKVIFLDKSARPLAWLTRELWNTLAPEPGSDTIPIQPDFKFLNIDREQWISSKEVRAQAKGELDVNAIVDAIDEDIIIGLRSIFNKHHDGSFDAVNELDEQVILVVDEVKSSGATLSIAEKFLARAFPTSIIIGEHWMASQYNKDGAIGNADLPIWYKNDKLDPANEVGRGVKNRTTNQAELDANPSKYFLSRRFAVPDQRSLRLREDLHALAQSVGENVPYIPHLLARSDESRENRSEIINKRPLLEVELARKAIKDADKLR